MHALLTARLRPRERRRAGSSKLPAWKLFKENMAGRQGFPNALMRNL